MHIFDGLSGVIVPVITPVEEQDRVDEPSFRKALRHVVEAGVDGVFVGGSAGEGPLLTEKEWRRMVEIAKDEIGNQLPLLAGVSDTSTARVVEKIRHLQPLGYRYFVATPTFYFPLIAPEEHLRFFGRCREAAGSLSMVAYNIPAFTGSSIPIAVFRDMAQRGWIRHAKESSGDYRYFLELLEIGRETGLRVFMGDERRVADALRAGAVGIVPACANFATEIFLAACRSARAEDWTRLEAIQEEILDLRRRFVLPGNLWVAAIKHVLSEMGIGNGRTIEPLQSLAPSQRREVSQACRILLSKEALIPSVATAGPFPSA